MAEKTKVIITSDGKTVKDNATDNSILSSVQDIQLSKISLPDATKFTAYLKTKNVDSVAPYLLKSTDVDPICLAAIIIKQTRNGTTKSFKDNNPGIFPNGNNSYTTFSTIQEGIDALISDIKNVYGQSDYLSTLRTYYVNQVISDDSYVGIIQQDLPDSVTYNKDAKDAITLSKQQIKWVTDVESIISDIYKEIFGGTPEYTKRNLSSKDNIVNKAKNSANATGTAIIRVIPHGDHADVVYAKLPRNKTFAEPVYPDLITVADSVPIYVKTNSTIPTSSSSLGIDFSSNQDVQSTGTTTSLSNGTTVTTDSNTVQSSSDETSPQKVLSNLLDNTSTLLNSTNTNNTILSRQIVYDPAKHRNTFKQPSTGKPANNNDPFPVDLKIEEFEIHFPYIRLHELECCPQEQHTGKALLEVASATEKRVVKLENNMATVLRYLMALGSRMYINCVYYGGQSQYKKYQCIRCLQDDRINDGQNVSIDQCLNCTRYEPNIGQCYEILSDKGTNLSQILDDNQMSYSNMKDYNKFIQPDQYSAKLDNGSASATSVSQRNATEKDFKDIWSKGIKMDWGLIPVEDQKPHIGWRQSINDDGSSLRKNKLASYQYNNLGSTLGSIKKNVWITNKESMDNSKEPTLSMYIASGKAKQGNIQENINGVSAKDFYKSIKSTVKTYGLKMNPMAISIISMETNTDPNYVVSSILAIETALHNSGIDNEIITAACYAIDSTGTKGVDYFIGNGSIPRLDKVATQDNGESTGSTSNGLNWNSVNTWKWIEFAPVLIKEAITTNLDLTPKICYEYEEFSKKANDIDSLIEERMSIYEGATMDDNGNAKTGCVEAVDKIGSSYSSFIESEFSNGIYSVPTFVSDAQNAGVPVLSFDASQLEEGDVIVYGDMDHVVIYKGPGNEFVGNSSGLMKVVRGSDYNEMGGISPSYIVKTSQY